MAPSSFPDWAMLDRHIYLRNDDSFPADEPTMAASAISRGDTICVCFKFDEPPRPSRVYLWWPGKGRCDRFSVVAAHRDAVLFQAIYKIQDCVFDVFEHLIYYVVDGRPSLDLIPHIEGTMAEFREAVHERRFRVTTQRLRRREDLGLAVLRRGHDWAAAELEITDDAAELHVFRSGGGGRWEATRPPVICHDAADMEHVRFYWRVDHSFSFRDYLCWVDYCLGAMFLCKVLDDDPVLEYMALPATLLDAVRDYHGGLPRHYHGIGVDEERGLLKFVMIARDDDKIVAHSFNEHDCFSIKAASWTWTIADRKWEVAETVNPSELVQDHGLDELPCNGVWHPMMVSKADMGTVYFMCKVDKVEEVGCPREMFLVAISMVWNTVLSAFPRVMPDVPNPSPDKLSFQFLLPIDLPKYLKQLDSSTTSFQGPLHVAPEVDYPSDQDLEDWILI